MDIQSSILKGKAIHDFPYQLKNRKCPHTFLISLTNAGGCTFSCPMCYARAYPWAELKTIKFYKNLPEKLKQEIRNLRIAFPFYLSQITDPLQPVSEIRSLTYQIVRIIIEHNLGFKVVTKSAEGIKELVRTISEVIKYPYWFVEITIESTPEKQFITSPNASSIKKRVETAKFLVNKGIEVIGRTDPTILGLIEPEDILWILEKIKDAGIKHIVASTGYYNKISMENLLLALKKSKFKDRIKKVIECYNYNPDLTKKRFMADIELRKKFHRWFKEKAEEKGLTYAVCQELPKDYDSKDIPTCEGSKRSPVFIRIDKKNFIPIGCYGDCLRSCPDEKNPPCGIPELKIEYPFKYKTILMGQPSLFG